MSKTVDVDLRIRAKNLSKSALKDITADVEKLTQAQTEQAKSADLASRSMRELLAEQKQAAALANELSKRRSTLKQYAEERAEIDSLSKKLIELTETRKRVSAAAASKDMFGVQLKGLDQAIRDTEKRMTSFIGRSEKTKATLEAVGVETGDVNKSMASISATISKANNAYDKATASITNHAAAVKRSNEVQAEAARRIREEEEALRRRNAATRESVGRSNAAAALRADIQQRAAQARALAISEEAQRRLRLEQEMESSTLARNNAAVREAIGRMNQLAVLRADIIKRSKETVAVQNQENAAREREKAILAEQSARRQRLIALIQSEKGQRLLSLEAMRREGQESRKAAASKTEFANATRRAANEQSFFADTGRKSLSVYQRIRGQVLGLASAYIGVYQAINTVSEAIDAVNRNQSLEIGLRTVNRGDTEAAARDYKFLRQETERLGLVFDDVAPKYANMAIAAREVGVSAEDTRKLFTDVATAVSAGNLSLDDTEGVFRAIVQIMGKARVQAEELRGQLGDRLPGAVAIFARENNIAIQDLDKLLKSGELGVEELVKFAEGYANQYAPVMDQATTRLQASINRARNAYNDWLRDLLNGQNQTKLKQAFQAIQDFFSGREGEEFAEALGKAFAALVDVLIWLADNIDLVTKALKIFIAVQVTKFAIDAAGSIKSLVTQVKALTTVSAAAGTNVGGLASKFGKLRVAMVGIAGILLGISAALNAQSTALKNTTNDLEDYTDLLDRIGRRQGKPKATTSAEAADNMKAIRAEIEDTERQAQRLQDFLDEFGSGIGGRLKASIKGVFGAGDLRELGIGPLSTVEEIQQRVNQLLAQAANLRRSETEELEIQYELGAKELRQQEEAERKAKAAAAKQEETEKERKAREKAERDAARAAARREREARAREAADDAAAKNVVQLQDEIEKTRVQSAARTDAQIQANFDATMNRISLDIEKKRLEIDALQRQSAAAGTDNSAKFTTMQALLADLKEAKETRAEEDRITALIELREQKINDLVAERNAKVQVQNTLMETGQQGALATQQNVNNLQDDYNQKIQLAIAEFVAFINTLDPEGELYKRLGLDKILLNLEQVNVETKKLTYGQKLFAAWGETVAEAGGNIMKAFSEAYAETRKLSDGFKAAGAAFMQFAADFLAQIAQMILQAIILQAITNAINNTSGGYGTAIKNAFVGAGHTGGIVGSGKVGANPRRLVSPLVFAGASKFHDGGMPGLRRDEVATILKKGEEVVTEDDPRHIGNGGMAAGRAGEVTLNNINVFDREEMASEVMKAKATGTALLNFVGKNASAMRQKLGIG